MPDWGWWAIGGAGALVVAVGLVLIVIVLWRRHERRYVMRLVADREAVRAGMRTLTEVVGKLAESSDAELLTFASDVQQLDRKALAEVHHQQEIIRDQLDSAALPKRLWDAADRLGAAAAAVAREAGRVGEQAGVDEAFEGLGATDLASAKTAVEAADAAVHAVCEAFGVDDGALYGGGLYI